MDEENKAVEEIQETAEANAEEPGVEEVKADEPKGDSSGGKGKAILAVAAVIILLILVTKFGGKKQTTTTPTETPTPTVEVMTYKVGEKIVAGDATITVTKMETSIGKGNVIPEAGNEWINVSMTIENTGATKQIIKSTEVMLLKDAEGTSYEVATTDKPANMGIDGTIAAGDKKTGWVGFEVKTGAAGLQLFYNAIAFGGGEVLISLGE